jgi:hypothetical protein
VAATLPYLSFKVVWASWASSGRWVDRGTVSGKAARVAPRSVVLARELGEAGLWDHAPPGVRAAEQARIAEGGYPSASDAVEASMFIADGEDLTEGGVERFLAKLAPALQRTRAGRVCSRSRLGRVHARCRSWTTLTTGSMTMARELHRFMGFSIVGSWALLLLMGLMLVVSKRPAGRTGGCSPSCRSPSACKCWLG